MTRRKFLQTTAASAAALTAAGPLLAAAAEEAGDAVITKATGYRVKFHRPKMVGKNSRLDVHGDGGSETFVRLDTDAGVSGLGWCPANKDQAARLLGTGVGDRFRPKQNDFEIPFDTGDAPLWDLLGKLRGQPVWKMLGGNGTETVGVYDGSIYFADLLPEFENDWRDQFKREIDMGRAAGHAAFKVKIGRGAKWMDRDAGDARDLEVLRVIREHGGPDLILGVDANNGYTPQSAIAFMREAGGLDLAFTEEMFPETVADCGALKDFYKEQKLDTLVADGETQGELAPYAPLVRAGVIDILQGDIRHFGFGGVLRMAAMAKTGGAKIAPHNWGSIAGFYMMTQVGRAVDNFYRAEKDCGTTPALVADGVTIKDGRASVSDAPGLGLDLVPENAPGDVEVLYELKM